jgi:hypothetical protein
MSHLTQKKKYYKSSSIVLLNYVVITIVAPTVLNFRKKKAPDYVAISSIVRSTAKIILVP